MGTPVQERAVCDLTCYFMQYLAWGSKGGLLVPREMNPDVPPEAVVVLSGSPRRLPDGTLDEHSPENVARVQWGAQVALEGRLPLYLCGATEQLEPMRQAVACYIDRDQVVEVSAGPYATANTKTQFEALARWAKEEDVETAVAVSSLFHVPRVDLTARAQAPAVAWFVLGPSPEYEGNVEPRAEVRRVLGETDRIWRYSRSGDIADPSVLGELLV